MDHGLCINCMLSPCLTFHATELASASQGLTCFETQVQMHLRELQKVLAQSEDYITGSFSYADIVMATAVHSSCTTDM